MRYDRLLALFTGTMQKHDVTRTPDDSDLLFRRPGEGAEADGGNSHGQSDKLPHLQGKEVRN